METDWLLVTVESQPKTCRLGLLTMGQILLEICCGSAEGALEAAAGSADRVELCSALFLGGLTPSLGSLLQVKQLAKIPVMAMNRPRAAGFCYSGTEFAVMERDADLLLEHGADGIVFGILNDDGTVDIERTRTLRKRIAPRQAVFHRAFDVTPDPFRALNELIDIGITRVLTSGQKNGAPEGFALIAKLIEHARDRIEVLPGAGIGLDNARELVAATRCTQIHLAAFKQRQDTSTQANPNIKFGSETGPSESTFALTDRVLVRRIKEELLAI
jgi:copper homeostasis protein